MYFLLSGTKTHIISTTFDYSELKPTMMIKKTLTTVFICVLLISCKKDEKTILPEPVIDSSVQNSPYTVSNATKFHGIFALNKTTLFSTSNHYNYIVSFYDTASASYYPGNLISVGNVKLNSKTINLDTTFHDYRASDLISGDYGTETWQIQGANGIPSFNYTSSTDPKCTNFLTLPDSFNVSIGITFTLNVTNIDTTANQYISLNDNSGHFTPSKPLQSGTNIITFTNAEFVNFNTTYMGSLDISLRNTEVLNFYGKNFQFVKTRSYVKFIKFKP